MSKWGGEKHTTWQSIGEHEEVVLVYAVVQFEYIRVHINKRKCEHCKDDVIKFT